MLDKDDKERIKSDILDEVISEYKTKKENLEIECKKKYSEYRKALIQLDTIDEILDKLEGEKEDEEWGNV